MTTTQGHDFLLLVKGCEPEDFKEELLNLLLCFIRIYSLSGGILYDKDNIHLWTSQRLIELLLNLDEQQRNSEKTMYLITI